MTADSRIVTRAQFFVIVREKKYLMLEDLQKAVTIDVTAVDLAGQRPNSWRWWNWKIAEREDTDFCGQGMKYVSLVIHRPLWCPCHHGVTAPVFVLQTRLVCCDYLLVGWGDLLWGYTGQFQSFASVKYYMTCPVHDTATVRYTLRCAGALRNAAFALRLGSASRVSVFAVKKSWNGTPATRAFCPSSAWAKFWLGGLFV
jgi:hypothetical protein